MNPPWKSYETLATFLKLRPGRPDDQNTMALNHPYLRSRCIGRESLRSMTSEPRWSQRIYRQRSGHYQLPAWLAHLDIKWMERAGNKCGSHEGQSTRDLLIMCAWFVLINTDWNQFKKVIVPKNRISTPTFRLPVCKAVHELKLGTTVRRRNLKKLHVQFWSNYRWLVAGDPANTHYQNDVR